MTYSRARTLSRRTRSTHVGRLYSIAGGAPNRPAVGLVGDAGWAKESPDDWCLTPQSIAFRRGYSRAGDVGDIAAWIDADREAWRAEQPSRINLPVLIIVEISQAPHLYRALESKLTDDPSTLTVAYRLRTGDISAIEGVPTYLEGASDVGANWLASWFDTQAARETPTEQKNGRPYAEGRTVVTFDQFETEEAPGLDRVQIRASLSAAESLRTKAQKDGDLSLALNADESLAGALMLSLLGMERSSPPARRDRTDDGPWGWNPQRGSNRGLRGIA